MKKELKKQAILVAAQRLFVEKGYNDASLQMIADEVGTTRSNILYHYKSKAALFE
ncbi:MAG TPA: TetR/AcrR family transcriptional regulator, partial [Brochothrix thermosphacta]|nr:TetR/AcrR family transcriptional regulator [Brochothrix thermosphacta]